MVSGVKKLPCSVIITVKNDARQLERTLESLVEQTQPANEVILAVAESTDETRAVAQDFAKSNPQWKVIDVGQASRSEGRNLAVRASRQPILVFTDAGCTADPDWLVSITAPLLERSTELVSGYTTVRNDSAFAEAQGAFVLVSLQKIGPHPHPATRNMALTHRLFDEIGGFRSDLNFAEDYEFARRLQAAGYQSQFVPEAQVEWQARSSLHEFFAMIVRLTAGDMQAGTWRLGHFSMWLRYLLFLALLGIALLVKPSVEAVSLVIAIYALYLITKIMRFRFSRLKSYFWAILLQVLTDSAVLAGTVQGLRKRQVRV